MRTFVHAAQVAIHHHAATHVKDLITDIGAFLEVETEGGLIANRVRVHGHIGLLNNRIGRNNIEIFLVVLAAEHASAVSGGIDDARVVNARIILDKDTFFGHVDGLLVLVIEELLLLETIVEDLAGVVAEVHHSQAVVLLQADLQPVCRRSH